MALSGVRAEHLRVTCDACGASAEVCAKRNTAEQYRRNATRAFEKQGWFVDVEPESRLRVYEWRRQQGKGRWYCPSCARKKHL